VTVNQALFREGFSGRVKVNTGFDMPLYKDFMLLKRNTYRETKGPCATEEKGATDESDEKTQEGCRNECDAKESCTGFTWNKADTKCITIGADDLKAGDAEADGVCFRKVRDAYDAV